MLRPMMPVPTKPIFVVLIGGAILPPAAARVDLRGGFPRILDPVIEPERIPFPGKGHVVVALQRSYAVRRRGRV